MLRRWTVHRRWRIQSITLVDSLAPVRRGDNPIRVVQGQSDARRILHIRRTQPFDKDAVADGTNPLGALPMSVRSKVDGARAHREENANLAGAGADWLAEVGNAFAEVEGVLQQLVFCDQLVWLGEPRWINYAA